MASIPPGLPLPSPPASFLSTPRNCPWLICPQALSPHARPDPSTIHGLTSSSGPLAPLPSRHLPSLPPARSLQQGRVWERLSVFPVHDPTPSLVTKAGAAARLPAERLESSPRPLTQPPEWARAIPILRACSLPHPACGSGPPPASLKVSSTSHLSLLQPTLYPSPPPRTSPEQPFQSRPSWPHPLTGHCPEPPTGRALSPLPCTPAVPLRATSRWSSSHCSPAALSGPPQPPPLQKRLLHKDPPDQHSGYWLWLG